MDDLPTNLGRRVGILGGTFDPVHNGHLGLARIIRQCLGLDTVLFLPAASPPHKPGIHITPLRQRLELLRLAVASLPWARISSMEARRPGPSYTIDTLRLLHGHLASAAKLFFILGADAFVEMHTWKEYDLLPRYATLVVVRRPQVERRAAVAFARRFFPHFTIVDRQPTGGRISPVGQQLLRGPEGEILLLDTPPLPYSSTTIRQAVNGGEPIDTMVPAPVAAEIRRQGLYRG